MPPSLQNVAAAVAVAAAALLGPAPEQENALAEREVAFDDFLVAL